MPELSRFGGIIVKMLYNDTVQHNKPHMANTRPPSALMVNCWRVRFR